MRVYLSLNLLSFILRLFVFVILVLFFNSYYLVIYSYRDGFKFFIKDSGDVLSFKKDGLFLEGNKFLGEMKIIFVRGVI